MLRLLDGVCVLGFVGVALWMVIYFARWQRLAALPVLWLSFTMILFQNLNALYFFYPSREKFVNMHNVFWAIFALMLAYALFAHPKPVAEPQDANAPEPFFHWLGWLAGAVLAVGLIIFAAGFVNGEMTMKSANTRWPRWSWTDGPFPGADKGL